MNVTFLPSFSDQLRQANIDPINLLEALEGYQIEVTDFIETNLDQFMDPLAYIQAKDHESTIVAFLELVPKLCPESPEAIAIEAHPAEATGGPRKRKLKRDE